MHLERRGGHEEETLHPLSLTKVREQSQEVIRPELVEVGELPSPGVVGLIDNDQVEWTSGENLVPSLPALCQLTRHDEHIAAVPRVRRRSRFFSSIPASVD